MSSLRYALHRKISDAAAAVKIAKDTHRKVEGVEFNALELYYHYPSYPLRSQRLGRTNYNPINPNPGTSALRKYSLYRTALSLTHPPPVQHT